LDQVLCLLKVGSQRVKEPLAVLLNVNLVVSHGFDYYAGLFHGCNMHCDLPLFQLWPPTEATSPQCKFFQLPYGKVAPINLSMIYAARFVIITAFVFCPMAQLRAEEKEPFAVIELGAATERSIQEGTYSVGPSASIEFPVIKDWLEIETGISPLFRPGQTEWQADLLFKKPFTINEHVEFMIGAGPQLSYATAGGGTQIASEFALEWMFWPTKDRKFGWFVEPTYSYSFSRGHEQAIGVTTGLTIAIP
jgi:hypothetical protein